MPAMLASTLLLHDVQRSSNLYTTVPTLITIGGAAFAVGSTYSLRGQRSH